MKHQTKFLKITVILVISFFLSACADKDHVSEETLPDSTPINQVDNSSASESSSESDNHSAAADPLYNDDSVTVEDVSFSLSESRQDIVAKLEEAGFDYYEAQLVH